MKHPRRCYLCRKTIKRALYAMERADTGEYVPVCNSCLREALLRPTKPPLPSSP